MKNMKTLSLAVITFTAATLIFSSCENDKIISKGERKFITMNVSTDNGLKTKSDDITSMHIEDLSVDGMDIFLSGTREMNTSNPFASIQTKGTVLTESSISNVPVTVSLGTNTISGFAGPSGVGPYWSIYKSETLTGEKVTWPEESETGNTAVDFKSYVYPNNLSWNGLSMDFAGPVTGTKAKDMNDYLMAYTAEKHDHNAQNIVDLKFYHALAAIRFKFDGVDVSKVTLKNVLSEGTATIKQVSSFEDGPITWSKQKTPVTYLADNFETSDKGLTEAPNSTFFIIGQDVKESDIEVAFVVKNANGQNIEITAKASKLGVDKWEAGYSYTYTISNTSGNLGIEVIEDSFTDGVSVTKSGVKVKNTARSTSYIRAFVATYWYNEGGKIVAPANVTINYDTNAWELGSDGYYYSKTPILGYATTADLIRSFSAEGIETPTSTVYSKLHLEMKIMAQAVEWDDLAANLKAAWNK